jgi:hypothetical protein
LPRGGDIGRGKSGVKYKQISSSRGSIVGIEESTNSVRIWSYCITLKQLFPIYICSSWISSHGFGLVARSAISRSSEPSLLDECSVQNTSSFRFGTLGRMSFTTWEQASLRFLMLHGTATHANNGSSPQLETGVKYCEVRQ